MIHATLEGRAFTLGDAHYVIARDQPQARQVRCYRRVGERVTLVRLPLVFVLEQLADEVWLAAPA
jgi:hypothetical protein